MPTTPSDPPLLRDVEGIYEDLWSEYLGGGWTMDVPDSPGLYAIATREGDFVGYRRFDYRGSEVVDVQAGHGEPGWQGWYWNVRLPPPPKEAPCVDQ